jgi:hypothetical protein
LRVAGALQNEPSVSRLALLTLLASGCFYTDPINQRPSADIIPKMSGDLYRGAMVELDAKTYDPEGQEVSVAWRVYMCTDATTPDGCDTDPWFTGFLPQAIFQIQVTRADNITPVEAIRVILEATDDHGATAKPPQELLAAVSDHPPDVTLGKQSNYGYVAGTPVSLFATVGDADDGALAVKPLDWQVFTPASQPAYTLVDLAAAPPSDYPVHVQFGKTFMTNGVGDFTFQVTATDPEGVKSPPPEAPLTVTMVADHAPCLTGFTPAAPASPDTLPINAATLFQVLVVSDDLDPFPTVTGDPFYGSEQFAWSLKAPGATTRQPLSIVGNSVAIDPSSYTPGDVLELRVEIQDRNHLDPSVQCADNMDTCSVISDQTCIQRLTWRIEVQ